MIYITLVFAVILAVFSVIHRQRQNLELACLISSLGYCLYYLADRFLYPNLRTMDFTIATVDGLWAYSLWIVKAPGAAIALAMLDFVMGLTVVTWPAIGGDLYGLLVFLVNLALVYSLTLAPLFNRIDHQKY